MERDLVGGRLDGEICFERRHLSPGCHDLLCRFLAELEDSFEEASVLLLQFATFLTLLDQNADLFGGMNPLQFRSSTLDAHQPNQSIRTGVEQSGGRTSDPGEHHERGGYPAADLLRVADGYGFGGLLPKNDVQKGNERNGHDRG